MDACRDLYLWDELVPVLERCVVSKRAFLGRETVKGSGHESLCTVFNFGNLTFNQFQRSKEIENYLFIYLFLFYVARIL